ncbi:increased DNA methylation 1-like isoform X2 [Macadamia integrifolia]|uniref:increased DNA methylation 1-like isoform X2 n=1 Tax=Macadamia integrifolia TaxID=60698 RepID=UPI001C4F513A|nr:increased DNA methylation 1-like isoform X2 [Macadamia integrifolia]XP_042504690.1 increased DNA methylation 1-like isoform X2 [Macadamia integrifolia]
MDMWSPYSNLMSTSQKEVWDKQDITACSGIQDVDTQKGNVHKNGICNICGGEGCVCCPLKYHEDCVGIKKLSEVTFHCPICVCKICGKVGNDQAPAFRCLQCDEFYHWHCIGAAAGDVEGDPNQDPYFCGETCKEVNLKLLNLLGIPHNIGNGLSCTLNQSIDPETVSRQGLPWDERMDGSAKLALAFKVFEECFQPNLDSEASLDRIPTTVFNSESKPSRVDCHGFYIFTLDKEDDVIAAASIRIHGTKIAEMPFIETREKYRSEGLCRRLVETIGYILLSIKVEKLVLPSTPEHVDYWTTHLGFMHISEIQRREMMSMNLMMFKDAVLLEKTLFRQGGSKEDQNGVEEDGPGGEDQPPVDRPIDLNLEPPEDDAIMNNVQENNVQENNVHHDNVENNEQERPQPLGIFLTLAPDDSLQLTRLFADGQSVFRSASGREEDRPVAH